MNRTYRSAVAAGVIGALVAFALPNPPAEAATVKATIVQSIDTSRYSPPSPDPAGITYLPSSGHILVSDSEVDETSLYEGVNTWELNLSGSPVRTGDTSRYTREPTGIAFDPRNSTMYVSDDNAGRIFVVRPGTDGLHGTPDDTWTSFDVTRFGDTDAEGVTVDTGTGDLVLAGGTTNDLFRLSPGPDGTFGGPDDTATRYDVGKYGAIDLEGISYDSVNGTWVALDTRAKSLFELDRSGSLVRIVDISAISPKGGGDVLAGPSSLGGGLRSYWIVLRGVNNDSDASENDGKLFEVSVSDGTPVNQAPTVTISSPSSGSTFAAGAAISFAGSATDPENGTLTPALAWVSSIDGPIGSGGSFTKALSTGTHQVTASVKDSAGATGSATVTVTVASSPPPPPPGGTATATLVADATIKKSNPGTNFGTTTKLQTDASPVEQFLLKFDVRGVSGHTVSSVKLRFVCTNASGSGGDIRRMSDAWVESGSGGVTWNTAPVADPTALASLGRVSSGGTYEVALPVSAVTGDGLISLRVTSASTNGADYSSKESGAGVAPRLVITLS